MSSQFSKTLYTIAYAPESFVNIRATSEGLRIENWEDKSLVAAVILSWREVKKLRETLSIEDRKVDEEA
ncbi:hypothetical protein [Gelria sp. Kuro-4]|uniref:hypothetical protein n=1 Tax=Gelria sp. Kuro-4 TaxID=2796927 RepID=UPI001BF011C9|nr:hypothetical protein [Gelria sp. Kuro-4]BCV23322.1 hypothetical protein kuro4_00950 [Gelria sp. Kuro-4]